MIFSTLNFRNSVLDVYLMMERNHHVTNLGLPPSDDILDQYNVSFALLDRMPVVLLPLFVSGLVYQKASGPEKEKKQQFATVSFA